MLASFFLAWAERAEPAAAAGPAPVLVPAACWARGWAERLELRRALEEAREECVDLKELVHRLRRKLRQALRAPPAPQAPPAPLFRV